LYALPLQCSGDFTYGERTCCYHTGYETVWVLGTERNKSHLCQWTLWDRHIDKLLVAHLIRKFPNFYGNQSSLSCSQNSTTWPYPEPVNPIHILTSSFLHNHFSILPCKYSGWNSKCIHHFQTNFLHFIKALFLVKHVTNLTEFFQAPCPTYMAVTSYK